MTVEGGGAVSNVRVNVVLYVSPGIMGQSFQGYCHRKLGFTKIGSIAASNYEMKSPIVLTHFYRRLKPSIVHQAGKLGTPYDLTFSCTTYSNKDPDTSCGTKNAQLPTVRGAEGFNEILFFSKDVEGGVIFIPTRARLGY